MRSASTRLPTLLLSLLFSLLLSQVLACRPTLTRSDLFSGEEVPDEEPLPTLRTSRSDETGEIIKRWRVLVYPDGRVERHGKEQVYHGDGTLKWEREYDHDSPSGSWNSYYADGSPRSEYTYAGSSVETTMSFYHQGGQLSARGPARNGVREGGWVFLYVDGVLRQEGRYREGRRLGVWTMRHANGGLESRGYFRDDARVGEWKRWRAEPPSMESDWQPPVPAQDWGARPVEAAERSRRVGEEGERGA